MPPPLPQLVELFQGRQVATGHTPHLRTQRWGVSRPPAHRRPSAQTPPPREDLIACLLGSPSAGGPHLQGLRAVPPRLSEAGLVPCVSMAVSLVEPRLCHLPPPTPDPFARAPAFSGRPWEWGVLRASPEQPLFVTKQPLCLCLWKELFSHGV